MKIVAAVLGILLLFGTVITAGAAWVVHEGILPGSLTLYEINQDTGGFLWITDFGSIKVDQQGQVIENLAGSIWQVNSDTRQVNRYTVTYTGSGDPSAVIPGHPVDARRSGDTLWWADGDANFFARVNLSDHKYTFWEIPDASWFYGTAIDDDGRFWASDAIQSQIYSFKVLENEISGSLCTYELPENGNNFYFLQLGDYLWLGNFGDQGKTTLIRAMVGDENLATATWELPPTSMPFGLAVDSEGDLWYADSNLKVLSELHTDSSGSQLKSYVLPNDGSPSMIAVEGSRIWYTGEDNTVGVLDPAVAAHTFISLNKTDGTLTPKPNGCRPISAVQSSISTLQPVYSGLIEWDSTLYSPIMSQDGWTVISMPESAVPWGITYMDPNVYVVDKVRHMLVRLPAVPTPTYDVFLPLIKR